MISIVIVNWNSGSLLENCIRSLFEHARGCEIIVVDNASEDSSLDFLEETDSVRIQRNNKNLGFAAGNNIGWSACRGNIILFLNPDTECLPKSISRLEQTLEADADVCAVGGRLVAPGGKFQSPYGAHTFPNTRSVAAEMLLLDEIWPSHPWSTALRTDSTTLAIDVDQPAAACLMLKRQALESIGGFDESFCPAWFEDVDLCRRIHDHGGRIQYQPGARFLHHGGHSLAQMPRQEFLKIFHTNQIRYFRKHHGIKTAARVRRWILFGLVLRSVLSFAHPIAPGMKRKSSARTFWNAAKHILRLREVEL